MGRLEFWHTKAHHRRSPAIGCTTHLANASAVETKELAVVMQFELRDDTFSIIQGHATGQQEISARISMAFDIYIYIKLSYGIPDCSI